MSVRESSDERGGKVTPKGKGQGQSYSRHEHVTRTASLGEPRRSCTQPPDLTGEERDLGTFRVSLRTSQLAGGRAEAWVGSPTPSHRSPRSDS